MLNFDNAQLSQLFRETYHHAMSATLIICPQEGVYLEFQRLGPGKLFPRLNRIYPVGFRGGMVYKPERSDAPPAQSGSEQAPSYADNSF